MADMAWACLTTRANKHAIASECPKFDEVEYERWLADHELGYFIRDEGSAWDCRFMSDVVFFQIYRFEHGDVDALFRRVIKI